MESGTTPEGFKKSFNSCAWVAGGLMLLLAISVVIMLFVLKDTNTEAPVENTPAPATQSQPQ